MKRNAVIRIVLWSIVLIVLLAILFTLIYVPGASRRIHNDTPVETVISVPLVTSPVDIASGNAITTSDLNIRSKPDTVAQVVGFAAKGTVLKILRQEQIGSIQWGYIGSPAKGWIAMDYVKLLETPVEETMESADFTTPVDTVSYNGTVMADAVNIRTMPDSESQVAGILQKGDPILISKQEIINEIPWGYTPAPVNGWVKMEFVELLEPSETETTVMATTDSQEPGVTGYGIAVDAASVQSMEIEWAAGAIVIQPMEVSEIRIAEEGINQESDPMVWKVRDGKLSIQYSKDTEHEFGMGLLRGEHCKNLTIQVPLNWQCSSLEIDAASASLEIKNLTIREMEFDGASGTCVFDNCSVEKLDVDTASGDVRFTGSLTQMDCDAASANIILELTNVPRGLDLDTASGDLDVTLPADAGFTVSMDTMSGEFESDFETTNRYGSHVAGDGRCRIDVDAMSGDVIVRKAK